MHTTAAEKHSRLLCDPKKRPEKHDQCMNAVRYSCLDQITCPPLPCTFKWSAPKCLSQSFEHATWPYTKTMN